MHPTKPAKSFAQHMLKPLQLLGLSPKPTLRRRRRRVVGRPKRPTIWINDPGDYPTYNSSKPNLTNECINARQGF